MTGAAHRLADAILAAAGGGDAPALHITGTGDLASAFAVTDLAAGAIGAAGCTVAALTGAEAATVDRRLASFWFATSLRPQGWTLPPVWDAVAGDYAARDGWIRLHTNAPHHRAAALRVLGAAEERAAVARAVATWPAGALETAVVEAGGCAAQMHDAAGWAAHPQGAAAASEPLIHLATVPATPHAWSPRPDRPLAGLRVLDLTRVLAGPVATRFLAGFGADVLRIDPPGWDEPSLVPEVTPGKRCARLDLRAPADRARFEALLAGADILLHGYRNGALEGLGYGEAARRALTPALIDVSLCAWGWTGPWARRRGFDSLVQMSSGIAAAGMAWKGADRPVPLPVQALDHATGYAMAAAAVAGVRRLWAEGRATTARLALARTAALLAAAPAADGAAPAVESEADLAPATEATVWGKARRLQPPLAVDSAPMAWELPAAPLGSAEPAWC